MWLAWRSFDSHRTAWTLAAKVALQSAVQNAPSLVPVLLYPGEETDFVRWFEKAGGHTFRHESSLRPRWQVWLLLAGVAYV